jgi:CheY-like chemotaxis protein
MARILVVDDEAAVRALIRAALEHVGHEVTEAANGAEGLKLFASQRQDLVITDVFMPERDGIELVRVIRSTAGTVPILVISGGSWPTESAHLLDAVVRLGATRTLAKPFQLSDLLRIVDEMLQGR